MAIASPCRHCSRSGPVAKFKAQTAFASDSSPLVEPQPRSSKPNLWILRIFIVLENIQDTPLMELSDRKSCYRLTNDLLELLQSALIFLVQYHTQEPRAGCWERVRLVNMLDLISLDHPDPCHNHTLMEPSLKPQCISVATGLCEPSPALLASSSRAPEPGLPVLSKHRISSPRYHSAVSSYSPS